MAGVIGTPLKSDTTGYLYGLTFILDLMAIRLKFF